MTKRGQHLARVLLEQHDRAPTAGAGSQKSKEAFLKRAMEILAYELEEAPGRDQEAEELRLVAISALEAVKLAHEHCDDPDLRQSLEFALRRAKEARLP